MRRVLLALTALLVLGSCGSRVIHLASRDAASLPGQALCGDPAIRGQLAEPVGGAGSCGIENPVRVSSVAGVVLSQSALLDCSAARSLRVWVDDVAKPAVGRRGGGLSSLDVAAHYACRTRNNQSGARISEHGRGRAIDISAIGLRDGERISVLDHWSTYRRGRLLRRLHGGACGPFGTVLGPESDRFHQDHFHFDTASYRSGPYCR
ncbi:Extensin-like protein C-terminus [Palleronia salina]|uniref:Extensin-like protein C-terminus n=1 Tax=Palleronia salina TaxID=313368 RepID=A0A1M6ING2_9RHOB|nr:extensin family protein [Palleronia salina]SHJ35933.1 Extensin-like protein C-terminus [Palleronia salina]